MNLPEYVTKEEVRRVCAELGIRDWSTLVSPKVLLVEAQRILEIVNAPKFPIAPEVFKEALEVELEHGTMYPDANVTNNHPILTGKIVLAHLHEMLDYYERLEVAELEGDLVKYLRVGNLSKVDAKLRALAQARLTLSQIEAKELG